MFIYKVKGNLCNMRIWHGQNGDHFVSAAVPCPGCRCALLKPQLIEHKPLLLSHVPLFLDVFNLNSMAQENPTN